MSYTHTATVMITLTGSLEREGSTFRAALMDLANVDLPPLSRHNKSHRHVQVVDFVSKQTHNPKSRIDNARLGQYHAVMKNMGFVSHEARERFRTALGIDKPVASGMTNAELDKVFEHLGVDH